VAVVVVQRHFVESLEPLLTHARGLNQAFEEKKKIINGSAAYYKTQGLHVSGKKRGDGLPSAPVNEVLDAVINALDGAIPETWIRQHIDSKYKQSQERVEQTSP
jgi:hypothetical protein